MARPVLEVADIFRNHGAAWRKANAGQVSLDQLKVMSAIEACRTAALGGHIERCEDCAHERVAYNSCRNRHCPKCQGAAARQWLAEREAELLPVAYYHVVFTLPTAVAEIAFQNKAAVYDLLFRAAAGGYGLAAQKALPNAVQTADRWHLIENASQAFLDAVRKSMRDIRAAVGAATINPELLTSAEKLQYEGFQRREETNAAILAMSKDGATIKQIVRGTGYSRGLVRKVLRGQRSDIFRVRSSSLEPYLPWLDEQWAAGRRNGSELWRSPKAQGFRGCLRVVSERSGRRHRSEKMDASVLGRAPSARTVARLMTVARDLLSKAETVTVAAIESSVVTLVAARDAVTEFQTLIRRKGLSELSLWIERAKTTLVASFANGVAKDIAAVTAAMTSEWSNGQTEGQICKLKLVKRQMYGRGKLDLLQARVIGFV